MTRCAVFGGGGVAGIAWATGVAAGLARQGLDVSQADAFVGTSAGSVVAARLACGEPLEALLREQLAPAAATKERIRPYSQADADAKNRALMDKVGGDLAQARRRIGAFALRSETVPAAERREIVAARLPQSQWPARDLRVVAVDTATGEHRVFAREDGVDFVDAIAASCAVPGAWPVVAIGGRAWMDGGIRSLTNADLAPQARAVLVIAPLGFASGNPVSGHLREEVAALRARGASVGVIVPDEASLAAMGDNVLDPARAAPSARCGLQQGLRAAGDVRGGWSVGEAG